MAKDLVLLLTGTIDPNNMAFTKLLDIESRRSQYIDAIRFWLKQVDFPIVFVENSGNDLGQVFAQEISAGKMLIYTFDGNNYDREIGKGYGELLCIEYAYKNCELIRKAGFIFKVTGRHKVLNFNSFVKQVEGEPEINILVNFYGFLKNCDSRVFGFTPLFIPDFLLKQKETLNDSNWVFFENALCIAALEAISKDYHFRPLNEVARISGSSGTLGISYNSSYLSWLKSKMMTFGRYNAFK